MFARGAKLSEHPTHDGALLLAVALSSQATRVVVLDELAGNGLNLNIRLTPTLTRNAQLTPTARAVAMAIENRVNLQISPDAASQSTRLDLSVWTAAATCLDRSSDGVTLIDLAGLLGDPDLQAYLVQLGIAPPVPLCAVGARVMRGWNWPRRRACIKGCRGDRRAAAPKRQVSAATNKSRAFSQLRRTVRSDTPSTSAISVSDRPPK